MEWVSLQSGITQRDLNVKEAWAQGFTGRGIVVSILDDGIEKNHPDLAGNYVSRLGGRQRFLVRVSRVSCSASMGRLLLTTATSFPGSWGQLRCQ